MIDILNMALSQYGIKEIPGKEDNPEVMKYYHDIGHKWVKNDEVAWCAGFANWCCQQCGYESTGKLTAQSFLDIGWEPKQPMLGDVVIFWRGNPNSWMGHVAFFIREDGDGIWVLGGNQSNQVNIKKYPKSRLKGFRRLKKL